MTSGGSGDDRLDRSQRREIAREKAKALRERQQRADRQGRFILQGSLILVSLAIVATVTVIIAGSVKPPRPGPLNMLSDGITIGQDFQVVTTPALQAGDKPAESGPDPEADAIAIEVYVDYLCPLCAVFQKTNDDRISTLLEQGAATIEIHPVAILDGRSVGTRYSTRAANAGACVANYSPNSFYAFNALLFDAQPPEQEAGLTDEELIGIADEAGVSNPSKIGECVTDLRFASWVEDATERATADPALLNDAGEFAIPAVFVNGDRYQGAPDDATAFAQFTAVADAAASSEQSTEPSPSPSPAP